MAFEETKCTLNIAIEETSMKQVSEFKYLGTTFTEDGLLKSLHTGYPGFPNFLSMGSCLLAASLFLEKVSNVLEERMNGWIKKSIYGVLR